MKNMILAICTTSLLALSAPTSSACFCAMPDLPKAYEQAIAVFVGEVVEIVPPRTSDEDRPLADRFYILKFKVEKSWKGSFPSLEMSLLSGQGDGCSSYPVVKVGEKYLVYADPVLNDGVSANGQMVITACNRTALIPAPINQTRQRSNSLEFNREDASQDLKALEMLPLMITGVSHRVTGQSSRQPATSRGNHGNQPEPKCCKP